MIFVRINTQSYHFHSLYANISNKLHTWRALTFLLEQVRSHIAFDFYDVPKIILHSYFIVFQGYKQYEINGNLR